MPSRAHRELNLSASNSGTDLGASARMVKHVRAAEESRRYMRETCTDEKVRRAANSPLSVSMVADLR